MLGPRHCRCCQTGRDPEEDEDEDEDADEDSALPDHGSVYDEPSGTQIDVSGLARRFPRLTAAYVGGSPQAPAPVERR